MAKLNVTNWKVKQFSINYRKLIDELNFTFLKTTKTLI